MSAAERRRSGDFRTTTEQGYGWQHQKARARLAPKVARGEVWCARCGEWIDPDDPEGWDLGHVDGDKSRYAGPEHRACNRATSAHRKARGESGGRRVRRLAGW